MRYAQVDFFVMPDGALSEITSLDDPKKLPDNIVQFSIPDDLNIETNRVDIGKLVIDPNTKIVDPKSIHMFFAGVYAEIKIPNDGDVTASFSSTLGVKWTGENLVKNTRRGLMQVEVPAHVNGSSHEIDLVTMKAIEKIDKPKYQPPLDAQIIASQIKAGVFSKDDFHPDTIRDINITLSAGNMAIIE